jgi:isoquinoline 1-oxidoreductase beta subunit
MHTAPSINRRNFLKVSSLTGGGLLLGFLLPGKGIAGPLTGEAPVLKPNAFLRIDTNGKVTVFVARQEIGQGIHTSLAMIVAEELEADWHTINIEIMPYSINPVPDYKPEGGAGLYDTGGSQSVFTDFAELRKVGATAKTLLITAAANKWKVKPEQCYAENGFIINKVTGAKLSFGSLVTDASALPMPKDVALKQQKDFKVIGKPLSKYKLKDVLTGKTMYGIDVKVPGMVYACVERCPVLDGKLVSVDDSACKQVTGFIKTVTFEGTGMPMHLHAGVAVVATTTWGAMKARKLLKITWDEGTDNKQNTEDLFKTFAAKANNKPLKDVYKKGDITHTGPNSHEAEYAEPFLAHGTMEPMNFTAHVKPGFSELWGGLQMADWAVQGVAAELGIKPEQVKANLTLSGGGFGRRLYYDFALEAVRIAKQLDSPVKVVWDRTDDVRNDAYRPANYHSMKATWDADGKLQTWQHHKLETSIEVMLEGPDTKSPPTMLGGGTSDFWYDVPNIYTGYSHVDFNLARGWVRAVEICENAYPIESFVDEIAHKLGKDPLQYRLGMLEGRGAFTTDDSHLHQDPARTANVLKIAAEKIGYHLPRKPKHFIGVATHYFSFAEAYAAHAVEIELTGPKKFKIVKITAVADCGTIINTDNTRNQIEGGTVFALSQALMSEITITNSRVDQDGFFTYQVLRINDMPPIDVTLVPSTERPGGVGELALPTLAPALCNAIFAASGERVRRLPVSKDGWEWE